MTEDDDKKLAQVCIDHIRNAPVAKKYVAKPSGNSGELKSCQQCAIKDERIRELEDEINYWRHYHAKEELDRLRDVIIKDVINVCKAHAEDGCFDYEGAEANAVRSVTDILNKLG